ncbi:YebC/PmpR family DNA-binding transcriptional regulator [Teredinibacter sp. KSP-S5-2]|uniref:YebC/PmpR family DNA-binding transcriptional regulator n=1 Tax=Teredinibacter sp. KSP-S5-2 TaxID=3034506 RepID=UPI002934C458|nr:YebC/PmpR family DNA-binding transcriptional regulator [Teredinibacter sp. KSP-S5-2]WNO09684.1 YebC/PmpR family DNA-binding transcriptional regulator [Teredinibacter sp. KSP-S5-2]
MAGHSKWANTKHRKAAQDAKRAKIFTKIIRELTVAAKSGGNPDDNPKLRATIDKALGANMKRDTIDKAVARGAGGGDDGNYDEITYEGYGVGGVAVIVECLTDNRNRTVSEVRHAFSKRGGNLGTDGSVAYLFSRKGQISFAEGADEEQIMEAALEAGAEDIVTNDDGSVDVFTEFEEYLSVKDSMMASGLEPASSEITMVPSIMVPITTKEDAEKTMALVDMLEDLDDVQNVYTNADIDESILAEFE